MIATAMFTVDSCDRYSYVHSGQMFTVDSCDSYSYVHSGHPVAPAASYIHSRHDAQLTLKPATGISEATFLQRMRRRSGNTWQVSSTGYCVMLSGNSRGAAICGAWPLTKMVTPSVVALAGSPALL